MIEFFGSFMDLIVKPISCDVNIPELSIFSVPVNFTSEYTLIG